ncbi:hypothetical protein L7F22_048806 [Adiantum nelumboides]|nr:hypothetical protein [Adiantum nelumboides]
MLTAQFLPTNFKKDMCTDWDKLDEKEDNVQGYIDRFWDTYLKAAPYINLSDNKVLHKFEGGLNPLMHVSKKDAPKDYMKSALNAEAQDMKWMLKRKATLTNEGSSKKVNIEEAQGKKPSRTSKNSIPKINLNKIKQFSKSFRRKRWRNESGKEGLVLDILGSTEADASLELCRAWGHVRDQQSLVFFDLGARANFITPQLVAEKMGIKTDEMGLTYTASMAAPGQEVALTPLIGKLRLHIQGYVGHEEFYIMPLEGCDVLLGESVPLVSASAVPRLMKQHFSAYLIYVKEKDETESSNLSSLEEAEHMEHLLCFGAWSEHGERTGGFYACNRYEAEKKEGKHDETERRREMAKNSLERYTHYYERWASNEQSKTKALSDLKQLQTSQLEKLSDRHSLPISQLKFITEAWLQIIECRRVLKWTYAYGFYLAEDDVARKQFFEYLQGEAEAGLERLHQCAEKDVKSHLDGDAPSESSFNDFRTKLAGLTSVTRTYFQKIVKALENGLADVESSAAGQGSSKGKNIRPKANSSKDDNSGRLVDEDGHWYCGHCTFANTGTSTTCSMCHLENP